MSKRRNGWRRVKFGEVVRQVKDRVDPATSGLSRYVAGEHMDTDDLRIRRWGDIGDGYLGPAFHMRFRPGHVLYGSRRTYLRKVAVASFEGICANTTFVLEPWKPSELLPEFLPFVMQTERFHEHAKRESKGSVNPYVNFSDIAWFEFELPPAEEQTRMLALLMRTANTLDAHREAVRAGESAYAAALVSTFVRRDPREGVSPDCWARAEWPLATLESLTAPGAPISYGIVQVGDSVDGGVPTATSNNLNIGFRVKVHLTHPRIEASYARSRIIAGDVLVTVKGFGTGNIGVVPGGFAGNISRDLARIRLSCDADAEYFVHLWRCPHFAQYWRAVSVGTTRPELSIGRLRLMGIPWPVPEVRRSVANDLSAVQRCSARLAARAADARSLLGVVLRRVMPLAEALVEP